MLRIKFRRSFQRKFIREVIDRVNSPSLRELGRRLNVNYSTLKNYYNEERSLPKNLFDDMCYVSKMDKERFGIEYINENWGQVKGGKKSKR